MASEAEVTEDSVEDLADTKQSTEAAAIEGVEDAADHPQRPTHTHEEYGRPDDVPPRNRRDEAAEDAANSSVVNSFDANLQ